MFLKLVLHELGLLKLACQPMPNIYSTRLCLCFFLFNSQFSQFFKLQLTYSVSLASRAQQSDSTILHIVWCDYHLSLYSDMRSFTVFSISIFSSFVSSTLAPCSIFSPNIIQRGSLPPASPHCHQSQLGCQVLRAAISLKCSSTPFYCRCSNPLLSTLSLNDYRRLRMHLPCL